MKNNKVLLLIITLISFGSLVGKGSSGGGGGGSHGFSGGGFHGGSSSHYSGSSIGHGYMGSHSYTGSHVTSHTMSPHTMKATRTTKSATSSHAARSHTGKIAPSHAPQHVSTQQASLSKSHPKAANAASKASTQHGNKISPASKKPTKLAGIHNAHAPAGWHHNFPGWWAVGGWGWGWGLFGGLWFFGGYPWWWWWQYYPLYYVNYIYPTYIRLDAGEPVDDDYSDEEDFDEDEE